MNTTREQVERFRVQYSTTPPMPEPSAHERMSAAVDAARLVLSRVGEQSAVAEVIDQQTHVVRRRYEVNAIGIVRRTL